MFPLPDRDQISERCGWRACLGRFFGRANSAFSYLIGLPIITLLGGLLVGYYQYLNAYQDKIRARGENDATMANDCIQRHFKEVFPGADASAGTALECFERAR